MTRSRGGFVAPAVALLVVAACSAGGGPGAPPADVVLALTPTRSDAAGTWGDPSGRGRSGRVWAVLDPAGPALVFDGCNTTGASSWRVTGDGTVVLGADAVTTLVGCPRTVPTSFALDGDVLVGRADDGQTWRVDRTSVLPVGPSPLGGRSHGPAYAHSERRNTAPSVTVG